MPTPPPSRRYRFGAYEADAALGELRRQGIRIRLSAQPFQVLCLLLDRPGELLTRDEIARELWADGTFVDFDHGVNSAINRIREALGDKAASPRFLETLARRGYRFVAPVEVIVRNGSVPETPDSAPTPPAAEPSGLLDNLLAAPHELPRTSHPVVQTLFVLLQVMYASFYVGALSNLAEIDDLLSPLTHAAAVFLLMIVTAGVLIPVRAFLVTAALMHAPGARTKLLTLWPWLVPFDLLWSLAPFLLLHHFSVGLALSCTALLLYAPFAQRALILMGAGEQAQSTGAA